jgi:hypothetical protein
MPVAEILGPKLPWSIRSAQAEFRPGLEEAHGDETNPQTADRPTPAV